MGTLAIKQWIWTLELLHERAAATLKQNSLMYGQTKNPNFLGLNKSDLTSLIPRERRKYLLHNGRDSDNLSVLF